MKRILKKCDTTRFFSKTFWCASFYYKLDSSNAKDWRGYFREYDYNISIDLVILINGSRHESSDKVISNGFVQLYCKGLLGRMLDFK